MIKDVNIKCRCQQRYFVLAAGCWLVNLATLYVVQCTWQQHEKYSSKSTVREFVWANIAHGWVPRRQTIDNRGRWTQKMKEKKTKQSDKAQGESPKLGHCYRTDKNRCRCQYTCKCVQMTLTIRFSLYFDLSGEGEEDGAAKTACTLSDDRRINAINELPNFIFVLILLSFLFNVCLCLTCAFVRSAFIPDQSQSQTETRKKIVGQ